MFTLHEITTLDIASAEGVSSMIQYSVRWAVPLIFLVAARSATFKLFPNGFSKWLMRNRRYFGLSFAIAMAWQGAFIFTMSFLHTDYYYSEIYHLRDELEGSSGYILLVALTFTFFSLALRYFTAQQWATLHRAGIYFLWAYTFSVNWWNVYYNKPGLLLDSIFFWFGFIAFALRIAAWGKLRWKSATKDFLSLSMGLFIVMVGLLLAGTSSYWQPLLSKFLLIASWSMVLELWLPFWPFEPLLPLFVIGLGVSIATKKQRPLSTPTSIESMR